MTVTRLSLQSEFMTITRQGPEAMDQPNPEDLIPNDSQENGDETTTSAKRRRQRNSIACDACHARRLKCDQSFPCARCMGRHINCEFTRERRKRGRAAAKSQSISNGLGHPENPAPESTVKSPTKPDHGVNGPVISDHRLSNGSPTMNFHRSPSTNGTGIVSAPSLGGRNSMSDAQPTPGAVGTFADDWLSALNGPHVPHSYDLFGSAGWPDGSFIGPLETLGTAEIGGYQLPRPASRIRMGQAPSSGSTEPALKYPVLQPLMPFLGSYLPKALVFDLLELYFTSAFSTHMHPVCHHIHCYVLRKASFLSRDNPRPSSPALLASMLWVAALDDRAFALAISPSKRRRTCQFLCALTVRLLKPLIHVSFKGEEASAHEAGYTAAAAHERPTAKSQSFEEGGDDRGLVGPAGSLDDIITYMHVASIVSASEQKAASMRWWHAAFTLARELKLNQEVEVSSSLDGPIEGASPQMDLGESNGISGLQNRNHLDFSGSSRSSLHCVCDKTRHRQNSMTEEHREERRRAWWLLYIMDRHLALCYNRPLALLDAECEDLLLPLDEGSWQSGNIHTNSPKADGPQCAVSGENNKRLIFPNFTCTGHSTFGFFLPLMIITGELIDLNQAKNHPTLGLRLQGMGAWDVHVAEVLRQLECYEASLRAFAGSTTGNAAAETSTFQPEPLHPSNPSIPHPAVPDHRPVETNLTYDHSSHTQTVIAYASHVVHVLHILLIGKWDPVSLFEDKDFWTSSPTFASATSHALGAAESVEQILRYDPDVSFMPYFFGIQLLQGSFLLLLIVDRLQKEAGEGILKACEVVIRATEACVVTLSTEYQRNFRQVMRSAVAQARGRPVNVSELRHRREAVLALYRWTRNGTGLAL